jgi:hypothetical protein
MSTCLRSSVELRLWIQTNLVVLLFLLPLCGCSETGSLAKQVTSLSQQVASLQINTLRLEEELRSSRAACHEITQSWSKYKKRLSHLEERVGELDGEVVSDNPYAFLMNNAQGRVDELEDRLEWIEARLQ